MAGRGHHYIPRFLLKGFASRRKDTWQTVVHRGKGAPYLANIDDVAKQKDFYGDPQNTALDDEITQRETHYAELLAHVRRGETLDDTTTHELRRLIAHLMTRTHALRASIKGGLSRAFDILERAVTDSDTLEAELRRTFEKEARMNGQHLNREQRAQLRFRASLQAKSLASEAAAFARAGVAGARPNPDDAARQSHQRVLLRWIEPEQRVQQLQSFKLTSIASTPHEPFILGDSPVVGFSTDAQPIDSISPANLVACLCLPISSTQAIVATSVECSFAPEPGHIVAASASLARQFFVAQQQNDFTRNLVPTIGTTPDALATMDWDRLESELRQELIDPSGAATPP